jgi:hypothetical protein
MDAFPFAGRRCERMTNAVMQRLGSSPYFPGTFLFGNHLTCVNASTNPRVAPAYSQRKGSP